AKDAKCEKIYGMRNGVEGLLDERYVDLYDQIKDDLDIELLKRTPASFLGSCRYKLPKAGVDETVYQKLFGILNDLNIKHFFYIGGNDSMDTIQKLSAYAKKINSDISFVGVPKTIDNDLAATDHTPGYGSAAKFIASAIKEIVCDSVIYPMESVTIVEIMGRNAGWLTAAAALSSGEDCVGPDLIYLPESEFDHEDFLNRIVELKKKKPSLVVAVSEGIKTKTGEYVCESNIENAAEDSFGHKILGGTADALASYITEKLGIKARGMAFSTLQRCAAHMVSRRDITEAFMAGSEAVKASLRGESGVMVVFVRTANEPYGIMTETRDINEIANLERTVPQEWIIENGTNVSKEFVAYARPLIIGELEPFMVDGLPRHLYLR
ncbi:MAG: 6-phosphofructokinase, partial [Oscillospiraceae bacterium]